VASKLSHSDHDEEKDRKKTKKESHDTALRYKNEPPGGLPAVREEEGSRLS
jgi:hypothetical protein